MVQSRVFTAKKINWNTQASVLDKFLVNEKVHRMIGMSDLKKRLQNHKEFYAYFHPAIESEPIIFVEVAYTKGIAKSVQNIIKRDSISENPDEFDTCIFYSINNCLNGLSRISLGNFLIKRVVEKIKQDKPNIKRFCTLSPIPEFASWVLENKGRNVKGIITDNELKNISKIHTKNFSFKELHTQNIKAVLLRLCAHYLVNKKVNKKPISKVANFHLGNGAFINDIVWNGDKSINTFLRNA